MKAVGLALLLFVGSAAWAMETHSSDDESNKAEDTIIPSEIQECIDELDRVSFMAETQQALELCQLGGKYNPKVKSTIVQQSLSQSLQFHTAILNNKIERVKNMIKNGANINTFNIDHDSPLHCAILLKHYDIAHLLIEAGADVNQLDFLGKAPLSRVATINDDVTFALLLAGANPTNCHPSECNKILVKANVLWGNPAMCIKRLCPINDIFFMSVWVQLEPHDFLKYDKVLSNKITQQEWYSIINKQDELGATCLMYAATLGNVTMVTWLLNHGANPSLKACGKTVFEFIDYILKHNTLSEAKRADYLKIIRLCVQRLDNRFLRLIQQHVLCESGHRVPNEILYVILDHLTQGTVTAYKLYPKQQTNQDIVHQEQDPAVMLKRAFIAALFWYCYKVIKIE